MKDYFIALSIIVSYGGQGGGKYLLSQTFCLRLEEHTSETFLYTLTQYLIRTEIDQRTIFT